MGLDYIMIPAEYAELFAKMPAEDVGAAVMALMAYNRTGERPEGLSAIADIAYTILEINYNRVVTAQKAKTDAKSANGKKGGRPRKSAREVEEREENEVESKEKPTQANESKDDFQKANESEEKLRKANESKDDFQKANESKKSNKNKIKENKINKNNIFNTPLSPLLGGDGAADEKSGDPGFDRFWEAYPRKVGKKAALSAYKRARCPVERMLQALEWQKASPQWRKDGGAYIPNPATWLNQGRWDDAPEETAPKAETPAESGYTLSAAELAAIANLQVLRDHMAAGG